jgi:hypothetical protein
VDIPLFPLLREELERIKATAGGSGYCFPKAAEMYQSNPDGISVRVKQVLARAFEQNDVAEGRLLAPPTEEEVRGKCLIYLAGLGDTTKAKRMRVVVGQYLDGASVDAIVKDTGYGQGTVSAYLNEVQKGAGVQLIRIPPRKRGLDRLQAARLNGLRRASIRDFHSFRVTWITLALAAGVPLELVQRVTGHRTVEVVMKHYFRPGREDFRTAILKAMPKMLADGTQVSLKDQIGAIVQGMTASTWRRDKAKIVRLLERM